MRARKTTWVIKASKLCNMRCSYCYEWEQLDRKDRISLELWERILRAIKDYQQIQQAVDPKARVTLVFHGGEPLALPVPYVRDVMALKNEILGEDRDLARVVLQTNALHLSEAWLELLQQYRIRCGVSHDVAPGGRRSIAGEPVENRVEANLTRLREAGLCSGGIVVLAAHTAPRIREVYDWYAERSLSFRVLPLFDGPDSRPAGYELSNDALSTAMCELFDHWIAAGAKVQVDPLVLYIGNAAQKILGIENRPFDRGIDGDSVFTVDTNGDLYHVPEAYEPGKALGNLGTRSLQDIFASEDYWASVNRDRDLFEAHCAACEYAGTCGGLPLQQSRQRGAHTGRCPVVYNLLGHIEQFLVDHGFGREELLALLEAQAQGAAAWAETIEY